MAKYFSVFILVTSILFLVACTPAAGQPASVEAPFTGQPVVAQPTSTPGATEPPAASTPTFIPSTVPAPVEKTAGALWVKILSPLDNSVIAAAEVDIQGQAPVDTVLSINDEIVQVGS